MTAGASPSSAAPPPTIALTNPIDPGVQRRLAERLRVVCAPDPRPETLHALVADADVLIVRTLLPPDIFERPNRLRGVVRHGVGVDLIPMDSAIRHSLPVANLPGSNSDAVAEYAVAGMLLMARQMHRIDRDLRDAGWAASRIHSDGATELTGATLGIVGLGNIGRRIAEICSSAFRMRVLSTPPRSRPLPPQVHGVALADLLQESDYVVLSCPLTDETRGLLDAARIALMKPTAALVNVARGQVVDEPALIDALRSRRIRGAVLDVFDRQPLEPGHPLLALDNVVLTPHLAGITADSLTRMSEGAVDAAMRLLAFERPQHLVNPQVWDAHLRRRAPSASASSGAAAGSA
ncbi:MAG TPA: NAD(P)-dependent oxidoreductase [Burkholderiaceae bacterium]|nr:NAD(P)-dependent oxidoreductase [Burkholderiaceae bacterium]